jgi:di/tricarboxylate transporter
VVGLVLIYPALARSAELPRPRPWLWYGLIGPALSILAIYSLPALPVLHGFQAPLAVLLFFGVWWLSEHCPRRVYLRLVAVQLLLNVGMLVAWGLTNGVHF